MKQSKKVRIGLRHFVVEGLSNNEWDALTLFASGGPLAPLKRVVKGDQRKQAVRVMCKLGVKRSRAKVREYLTKCGYDSWQECKYFGRALYVRYSY